MNKIDINKNTVDEYYDLICNDFSIDGKNKSGLLNLIDKYVLNSVEKTNLKGQLTNLIKNKPNDLEALIPILKTLTFSISKNYSGHILKTTGLTTKGVLSLEEFNKRLSDVKEDNDSKKFSKIIKQEFKSNHDKDLKISDLKNKIKKELKKINVKKIEAPKINLTGNSSWNEIFKYKEHFQPLVSPFLGEKLNLKVCPYCNNQYIQTLDKTKVQDKHGNDKLDKKGKPIYKIQTNFQLDHIYPKSIYPYFALSIYNLIPSCSNCNLGKTDEDTVITNKIINPYEESFHEFVKFETTKLSDEQLVKDLVEKSLFTPSTINISLVERLGKNTGGKLLNHKNFFNLESIYKQHNDIVCEIYEKAYYYNESRRSELVDFFQANSKVSFSDEEIVRFILGNYVNEEDFNKRIHSKLTHDVATELKLLNKIPINKNTLTIPLTNRSVKLNWWQRCFKEIANLFRKIANSLDKKANKKPI